MRNVNAYNSVLLDGYFTDANNDYRWAHEGADDPELMEFTKGNAQGANTLVFGRVTYELMVAWWPTHEGGESDARYRKGDERGTQVCLLPHARGGPLHAELSICGSTVMMGDPDHKLYSEPKSLGHTTAGLHIFVDDNAALLRRALKTGCEEIQPPTMMFYGANSASVRPFGHVWVLLSWKEDLAPAEMERRAKEYFAQ